MQKNDPTHSSHGHKGTASLKLSPDNSTNQSRATTAAKNARIEEAGLGGNRTGEVSAAVKRSQADRDAITATIPADSVPSSASSDAQHLEGHPIQVQVNTDHNIHGSEKLHLHVQDAVKASLGRFGRQVTRVEIHLSDDDGSKSHGDDKRCVLEARPAGHQPLVVTHVGATVDEAVNGAVDMMEKLLDRTFAKLHDPKGRTSLGEDSSL